MAPPSSGLPARSASAAPSLPSLAQTHGRRSCPTRDRPAAGAARSFCAATSAGSRSSVLFSSIVHRRPACEPPSAATTPAESPPRGAIPENGWAVMVEGLQVRVVTLGDSILDCGSYNPHGLTPGQLL